MRPCCLIMTRTVLRLRASRWAISRTLNAFLVQEEHGVTLARFDHGVSSPSRRRAMETQEGGRQQVGLGEEGPAASPPVVALADDPSHGLVAEFQIVEQATLEAAAAIGCSEIFRMLSSDRAR